MKIESTTSYNYSPNFGAKLAPQTLKLLLREIESGPKGDKVLAECLETVKRIGHKDTIIALGEAIMRGEYVSSGSEMPEEYNTFFVRNVTLSNPLLGEDAVEYEERMSPSIEFSIREMSDWFVPWKEARIFEQRLKNNKDKMPLEIFSGILPFLKSNKRTLDEVFFVAKRYNKEFLENKKIELENMKQTLVSQEKHSQDIINEVEEQLQQEEIMTEREKILDTYM